MRDRKKSDSKYKHELSQARTIISTFLFALVLLLLPFRAHPRSLFFCTDVANAV